MPTAPAQGVSGVGPDTTFSWTGGSPVSVLWVEHSNFYEAVFVVTAKKEAALEGLPSLRSGEPCFWGVEGHGTFASVDAATGPNGMLSAYSGDRPLGPKRGSGTYTLSEFRGFTSE